MTGKTRTDDDVGQDLGHESDGMDPARRAALLAIAKYSGAVGAAATLTVLSAQDAVAQQSCSDPPCNGNNGFGNGDQDAPGGSEDNNNAENAGGNANGANVRRQGNNKFGESDGFETF